MLKKPFLLFILAISIWVGGLIWFIQSPQFAVVLKSLASKYLPKDLGIEGNFTELSVKLFPPGISALNPQVQVGEKNRLGLPAGSAVKAERIDFIFRPLQALSGDIRIHEVSVIHGEVRLNLEDFLSDQPRPVQKKAATGLGKFNFHWDELFQIRAEAVSLENVSFHLNFFPRESSTQFSTSGASPSQATPKTLSGTLERLRLGQWSGKGGLGYSLELKLRQLQGTYLNRFQLGSSSHSGPSGHSGSQSGPSSPSQALPQTPIAELAASLTLNALGMQIDQLIIALRGTDGGTDGAQVTASGKVTGNFLDSRNGLLADLQLSVQGPFKSILGLHSGLALKTLPEGHLNFKGHLEGDLKKPMESIQAEGKMDLNHFSFQEWKAESVQAEVKWNGAGRLGESSGSGASGELELKKAILSSPQVSRRGGFQPGEGGTVEIGPVKWSPGASSEIQIPVRFEHAHIHWLAAPVLKGVYPLDFRLNGTSSLTFVPSTPSGASEGQLSGGPSLKPTVKPTVKPASKPTWELRAKLSNWVEGFRLDNQRYQKSRPMRAVFTVPKISLDGLVRVNAGGVFPSQLSLELPHSKVRIHGGIRPKSGYDLRAEGQVDLADLGHISENEIQGKGDLNLWVHGPTSNLWIDIDADLKEVSYLKLFLGDMKGRISWEDDPQNLIFSQVEARKLATQYHLDGRLELGKTEQIQPKIHLDVKIPQGTIQDFIQIFSNLTRSVSWFPHDLNGPMSGSLAVRGGLDLSRLQVLGKLNGQNWETWGERFKTVSLEGGFDRGIYLLNQFRIFKRFGWIHGGIRFGSSISADSEMSWKLQTEGLTVADLDQIARLDVPIRGKINILSSGDLQKKPGGGDSIRSNTQMDLTDFTVRGLASPSSHFTWTTENGIAKANGSAMGGQGRLEMEYNFNSKQSSSLQADLKQLDFTPVLLLLNPKSIEDRSLTGLISGKVDLNFHAGEVEKATGELSISEYLLARSNTRFSLVRPVSFHVTDGSYEVHGLGIRGRTGEIQAELKGQSGQLSGYVTGKLDASIVEFFTPVVTQVIGTAGLNLAIGGKLKEPTVSGQADLAISSAKIASLDSAFENVSGKIQLHQNQVSVQHLKGEMGGGRVGLEGQLELYPDRYPRIRLNASVKDSKLRVYPFQYAKISGSLGMQGDQLPYAIDGKIFVESALSKEKVLNQKKGSGTLKVLQYAPPPGKQGDSGYSKFRLNIDVDAPKGIAIQNDLFRDVQARGRLKLVNTLEAPRVIGTAEIMQGKLLFKDHIFQIQNAVANFDSPTVINPRFDLNAATEVNNVKIQLYASGRMDRMRVEFSSNPAMPESEIFSLLAMGLTSSDAKKLSATDLNAVQQGEAASLVLHSLDFNRDLEDKTGFQVQLDESVNTQQGVSAFRPQSQVDSAAAPQITIRRKIGDRLSISAGRTLGTGTIQSNQANLDLSVNRNLSITGVFNNYGTSGAADTQLNQQNSWGLDIKFQKRFK